LPPWPSAMPGIAFLEAMDITSGLRRPARALSAGRRRQRCGADPAQIPCRPSGRPRGRLFSSSNQTLLQEERSRDRRAASAQLQRSRRALDLRRSEEFGLPTASFL
jgi:hypothetical protein